MGGGMDMRLQARYAGRQGLMGNGARRAYPCTVRVRARCHVARLATGLGGKSLRRAMGRGQTSDSEEITRPDPSVHAH
jgi:hypothetical protein